MSELFGLFFGMTFFLMAVCVFYMMQESYKARKSSEKLNDHYNKLESLCASKTFDERVGLDSDKKFLEMSIKSDKTFREALQAQMIKDHFNLDVKNKKE